jgi:hypothetical protein
LGLRAEEAPSVSDKVELICLVLYFVLLLFRALMRRCEGIVSVMDLGMSVLWLNKQHSLQIPFEKTVAEYLPCLT